MDQTVVNGLLSIPFIKQELDVSEEGSGSSTEPAAVIGILWKVGS